MFRDAFRNGSRRLDQYLSRVFNRYCYRYARYSTCFFSLSSNFTMRVLEALSRGTVDFVRVARIDESVGAGVRSIRNGKKVDVVLRSRGRNSPTRHADEGTHDPIYRAHTAVYGVT